MSNKTNIQIVSREGKIIHFPGATGAVQFGDVMQDARSRKKISQEEMAKLMGVTRYTIMNWEQNKNKPDCDMLPRLCSILGITINDLFGIKMEYTQMERALISNFRLLKPTTQRIAASLIDSMVAKELAAHDEMLVNTTRMMSSPALLPPVRRVPVSISLTPSPLRSLSPLMTRRKRLMQWSA